MAVALQSWTGIDVIPFKFKMTKVWICCTLTAMTMTIKSTYFGIGKETEIR